LFYYRALIVYVKLFREKIWVRFVNVKARAFLPSRPDVHVRATFAKPALRAKAAEGGFVRKAGGFYPPAELSGLFIYGI
jgi:hypothetical protein